MEGVLIPKVKKGVPRIRFAGFNDDWGASKLEPLCQRIMVGIASAATHAYRAKGIPMFRNQNIKEEGLDDSDLIFIDETYERIHRGKRLKGGDILTVRTGYPGLSCVVPDKYADAQCFTSLIVRPKPEHLVSEWLAQYINSPVGKRKMFAFEAGGAQKNINSGSLENLVVPVISLPEQQKIAAFLGAVDRKIQQLKFKQELLERYKKGVVQQLFSQELRFKDAKGKNYPDWEERELSEVLTEHKLNSTGKEEVYSVSVHKSLINQVEHLGRVYAAESTDHYNRVLPGDMVYTKSPTGEFKYGIIKQSRLDKAVIVSPLYGVFTPESRALGYWLDAYFESILNTYNYLHPIVQKGAKNTIAITNRNFLSNTLKLPVSFEEQSRIAGFLMALDAKVAGVAQAVAAAQRWKKGLLQQMFV